jgi:hypothetical protein
MTRGQNDLIMDHNTEKMQSSDVQSQLPTPSDLVITFATPEEENLHQQLMSDIAKKAKTTPTWLN